MTLIRNRYQTVFGIDSDKAMEMALETKGYAFAYQALGKYVWESNEKDKQYMRYIVTKEQIDVNEVLALAKCKSNEFSQYRKRLATKGLIDISQYGSIKYTLPRFNIFVENQIE